MKCPVPQKSRWDRRPPIGKWVGGSFDGCRLVKDSVADDQSGPDKQQKKTPWLGYT